MPKLKLSIILSFFASIIIVFTVFADELTDFQYTHETYLAAYQSFAVARSAYLKHQTVATENELIDKTTDTLEKRAKVYITYFQALQAELKKTSKIKEEDRNYLNDQLKTEIAKTEIFINKLNNLEKSIENLKESNNNFEDNQSSFQKTAFLSITQVSLDKVMKFNQQVKEQNNELEKILGEIEVPTKDEPILKNWLADSKRFSKEIDDAVALTLQEWEIHKNYRLTSNTNKNTKYYHFFESQIYQINEKLEKAIFYQNQILDQIK